MIEAPLPKGVADFLPEKADKIGYIEGKIRRVFELWGFRRIITPLLEFHDVLALGMGEELKEKTFRFDDRQTGRLVAIPPDITPQVARIVATRMQGYPLPHRLYYNGRVLRHAESQSGRSREIFQSGVELIGLDSPEADAEMVAMAIEALQGLGLRRVQDGPGTGRVFPRHHGCVRSFPAVAQASPGGDLKKGCLRGQRHPGEGDGVRFRKGRDRCSSPPFRGQRGAGLRLLGSPATTVPKKRWTTWQRSWISSTFTAYRSILRSTSVKSAGLDYHTGLTFEGFVGGLGEPVCGGGQIRRPDGEIRLSLRLPPGLHSTSSRFFLPLNGDPMWKRARRRTFFSSISKRIAATFWK